jgi:hypothetical protein
MNFERKKMNLLEFARERVVNEESNLNFTGKSINLIKFEAFSSFQQDYNTERQIDQGLFPYLEHEYYSPSQGCRTRRFSRRVSGNRLTRCTQHLRSNNHCTFDDGKSEGLRVCHAIDDVNVEKKARKWQEVVVETI